MLIIGKTSEGNHTFMNMKKISVQIGKQKTSFLLMLMDVNMNIDASILMDGKNKNIILSIIKCMLVDNKMFV